MPDIPAGGRELSGLIAVSAVKYGCAVSFDLDAADPPRTVSA